MARCVRLFSRSSVARAFASGLIDRSNGRLQFPLSMISRMYPATAAAAPGACDLSGETTPADLAALIRRADVAVTNDSGSMHVAASLGKPMVSVFGPTNPVHIGPYERPESVVRVDLPCSPCNYRRLSQCPFGHACMKQVTSAMVVERVRKILGNAKSPAEAANCFSSP